MTVLLLAATALTLALVVLLWPRTADAHCDTIDGPAVADGRTALETGNVNHALRWVGPDAEAEVTEVFGLATRVRTLGGDALTVADRLFLETLVRLHRAGEGAPFDGLKPSGTPVDPVVAAADAAIALGRIDPLVGLVPGERLHELEHRLEHALALKDVPVDDVEAGRRSLAAYVAFVLYAEGEDDHHGDHALAPAGHHHH